LGNRMFAKRWGVNQGQGKKGFKKTFFGSQALPILEAPLTDDKKEPALGTTLFGS